MHTLLLQNVPPKAGTPGVAVQSAPPPGQPQQPPPPGGGLWMFLPLLMVVPFLWMSMRRQKKEQEARGKLKKGDRVVSQSGLVGELVEMDERLAKVKIAAGVTVQMLTSSLSALEADTKKTEDAASVKDAKVATEKK